MAFYGFTGGGTLSGIFVREPLMVGPLAFSGVTFGGPNSRSVCSSSWFGFGPTDTKSVSGPACGYSRNHQDPSSPTSIPSESRIERSVLKTPDPMSSCSYPSFPCGIIPSDSQIPGSIRSSFLGIRSHLHPSSLKTKANCWAICLASGSLTYANSTVIPLNLDRRVIAPDWSAKNLGRRLAARRSLFAFSASRSAPTFRFSWRNPSARAAESWTSFSSASLSLMLLLASSSARWLASPAALPASPASFWALEISIFDCSSCRVWILSSIVEIRAIIGRWSLEFVVPNLWKTHETTPKPAPRITAAITENKYQRFQRSCLSWRRCKSFCREFFSAFRELSSIERISCELFASLWLFSVSVVTATAVVEIRAQARRRHKRISLPS